MAAKDSSIAFSMFEVKYPGAVCRQEECDGRYK